MLFGGNCATVNLDVEVVAEPEQEDCTFDIYVFGGGEGTECAIGVHEEAGIGTKSGAAAAIPTDFFCGSRSDVSFTRLSATEFTWTTFS